MLNYIELKGKYNNAKIFTHNVEETALGQVVELLNNEISTDSQLRFMPDIHSGKGCVIGTTIMTLDKSFKKVVPNIVGVDIGCGMRMAKISNYSHLDLAIIDKAVHKAVPSGFNVHDKANRKYEEALSKLSFNLKNEEHVLKSMGTLGGGNHYVELGEDEDGNFWLSVHTGSRNLGVQVATHHQKIAEINFKNRKADIQDTINKLKKDGRDNEIQAFINEIKLTNPKGNKDLAYLDGNELNNYLNDMTIAQEYAKNNRIEIINNIIKEINDSWKIEDEFDSIHNYIDIKNGIIRKGATSAQKGERLIIPLNMRDGSVIAIGKGNKEWNYSAPHGAGRIMSRSQAKRDVELEDFEETMKDVYSSSIGESTLDESPFAYKPMDEIIENIHETVDIVSFVKPIYNFKAH